MGIGAILILIGASVIALSIVIAVGAMNGKLEGVVTIKEKFLGKKTTSFNFYS